jgi:hypothetical protein
VIRLDHALAATLRAPIGLDMHFPRAEVWLDARLPERPHYRPSSGCLCSLNIEYLGNCSVNCPVLVADFFQLSPVMDWIRTDSSMPLHDINLFRYSDKPNESHVLKLLLRNGAPRRIIDRVPASDQDWREVLDKEVTAQHAGVNSNGLITMQDLTFHVIGLKLTSLQYRFSETVRKRTELPKCLHPPASSVDPLDMG